MKQMTIPSKVALAALRKCVADATLAEAQLLTQLHIIKRFKRDAQLALKIAERHARDKTITFTTGKKEG